MKFLKYLLATIALAMLVCVTIALVLPPYQQYREARRREETRRNLEQLGKALHQYEEVQRKTSDSVGAARNADRH